MSEQRWDLPPTWLWSTFGEVSTIVGGGTPSAGDESNFDDQGISWLTPADLTGYKGTYIAKGRRSLSVKGFSESAAKLLPPGAVLFSSRAPIGYCAIASNELCTNQGFKSFILVAESSPEYARHYLLASTAYAESLSSGTTFKELSGARAADMAFPLAPFLEQRRIVSKIDSLTAKSKRARDNLKYVPRLVEKYKQAILARCFSGQMTSRWREENPDCVLDAKKVVQQIESDKLLFMSQSMRAFESKKRAGQKVTKPRELTVPDPVSSDQFAQLWSLPPEWQWLQIGCFAFVTKLAGFEYTDYVKYDPTGDLKVIKAENAGLNGFKPTDFSKIQSSSVAHLERSILTGGELLVVFVGAGTGQVALVPENDKFFLGPNIGMARPYTQSVSPRYLELFLRSDAGKSLLLLSAKAVAQPSLSMGAIRSTPVALPSHGEQIEIVRRIESAFAWIDRLASEATSARKLIDHLDQAILSKAFRGELVPQDPNDEPASVLLERIRAERASTPVVKRGRRKLA
ncbi:Type-1 restriction enzyme EcoKI specificity protein [Asticcacaulis sp. MM231]|uniref:restriction endonuclease subunit S n=1 Tax=Asticcacaulis sp. MM231 TaxID=3157666 RepID=UPI0032D5A246